jgi:hypothetical protein
MSDECGPDECEGGERQVPEGAAVFPLIPEELGVDPLLLAVLHATVFLDGSEEDVIDPDAADEAVQYVATYLQRLGGPRLERVREDLEALLGYARQQGWPKAQQRFLKDFLNDYVSGEEGGA